MYLSQAIAGAIALLLITTVYFLKLARSVYLINFTTYQPPDSLKVPYERFMEQSVISGRK